MCISAAAAIIGSTVLGVGGSIISGREAQDAADDQARNQREASEQEYARNQAAIASFRQNSPYASERAGHYGSQAMRQVGDLLGFSDAPAPSGPVNPNSPGAVFASNAGRTADSRNGRAYLDANPAVSAFWDRAVAGDDPHGLVSRFGSREGFGDFHYDQYGRAAGWDSGMPAPGSNPNQPGRDIILGPDNTIPYDPNSPGSVFAAGAADNRTASLRADPGYQFAFDEGLRAIEQSGVHSGMSLSSAQQKRIFDHGLGMADQLYDRVLSRRYDFMDRTSQDAARTLSAETGNNEVLADGQYRAAASERQGQDARAGAYAGAFQALNRGIGQYGADQGWEGF
ncbi:MAG: hypothetical protein VXW22_12730 [Pseudomonadota bacterium]|nr:hypothetical protein [Pseudomonadota bacterium]